MSYVNGNQPTISHLKNIEYEEHPSTQLRTELLSIFRDLSLALIWPLHFGVGCFSYNTL